VLTVKFKNILAQKKEFQTRAQKKEFQTQDTSCSGDPPLSTSVDGQLAASDKDLIVADQQQKAASSDQGTAASSKQKQQLDVSDKQQLSAFNKQQELTASNNQQQTGSGEEHLTGYCEKQIRTTGVEDSTAAAKQLPSEVAPSREGELTTATPVGLQQPAVVEQPKKNKWNKKKPNISNDEVPPVPRASSTGRNEDTRKTRVRMDYSCYIAEPGAPPFREQSPVFGPPAFQPFGRERAQVRGQAPFRAHSAKVGLLQTPTDSLLPTPDEASVRRQASYYRQAPNHRPASHHRQDSNYRQASSHRQPARRGQSSNRMQATYNYRVDSQDPRQVAGQE